MAEFYMCRTDYEHELGAAKGGNVVFPSVEDLKRHSGCAAECGIVAVRVELVGVVEEGRLHGPNAASATAGGVGAMENLDWHKKIGGLRSENS